jgi:hypothetical protein
MGGQRGPNTAMDNANGPTRAYGADLRILSELKYRSCVLDGVTEQWFSNCNILSLHGLTGTLRSRCITIPPCYERTSQSTAESATTPLLYWSDDALRTCPYWSGGDIPCSSTKSIPSTLNLAAQGRSLSTSP